MSRSLGVLEVNVRRVSACKERNDIYIYRKRKTIESEDAIAAAAAPDVFFRCGPAARRLVFPCSSTALCTGRSMASAQPARHEKSPQEYCHALRINQRCGNQSVLGILRA